MAKKFPKRTKITVIESKPIPSHVHVKLLASEEWKRVQELLKIEGPTPDRLAQVAPLMWRVVRMWERLLPELDQLPPEIRDTLCLVLTERPFKPPGPRRKVDWEDVVQFMHKLLSAAKAKGHPQSVLWAASKAVKEFQDTFEASSAEKRYYAARKKHPELFV